MYAKNKKKQWYIDNGYLKHMTGDKIFFPNLKKGKGGNFTFANDVSTKIVGKCTVSLGNAKTKAQNVLLVENMKHNLLSVSQMCDQGHTLMFDCQKCEIRFKQNSGKLVATTTKNPNNVYILNTNMKE